MFLPGKAAPSHPNTVRQSPRAERISPDSPRVSTATPSPAGAGLGASDKAGLDSAEGLPGLATAWVSAAGGDRTRIGPVTILGAAVGRLSWIGPLSAAACFFPFCRRVPNTPFIKVN